MDQLREGDVVVDAGAFPGDYTLFAARQVGSSGRVIALEPDPKNRNRLERNIHKSGYPNIEVLPYGLWDIETSLHLDAGGVASTLSSSDTDTGVRVKPLDSLLAEVGVDRIDVLKMDIEGAELQALRGAEQFLRSCRYVCVASYHMVDGEPTAGRVEALLSAAGLQVETGYPKHLTTTGVRL